MPVLAQATVVEPGTEVLVVLVVQVVQVVQ